MPATRSGSGSPSSFDAQTTACPSALTRPQLADDLAQPRIVVHRHELGRVDRHVLREAAAGDDLLDGGQRLGHVEPVDGAAQDACPGAHAIAAAGARRPGTPRAGRRRRGRPHGRPRAGSRTASAGGPTTRIVEQARRVVAEQDVGAVADRHGPLGVGAQRVARDAERRRLLLHAARVGRRWRPRRPAATGSRGSRPARCSALPPARGARDRRPHPAARGCAGGSGRRSAPRSARRQSAVDDARPGGRGRRRSTAGGA